MHYVAPRARQMNKYLLVKFGRNIASLSLVSLYLCSLRAVLYCHGLQVGLYVIRTAELGSETVEWIWRVVLALLHRPLATSTFSHRFCFCRYKQQRRTSRHWIYAANLCISSPAHVVQWSNHLGDMCSRAWRSQWPRIDSSLGPGASAY